MKSDIADEDDEDIAPTSRRRGKVSDSNADNASDDARSEGSLQSDLDIDGDDGGLFGSDDEKDSAQLR